MYCILMYLLYIVGSPRLHWDQCILSHQCIQCILNQCARQAVLAQFLHHYIVTLHRYISEQCILTSAF